MDTATTKEQQTEGEHTSPIRQVRQLCATGHCISCSATHPMPCFKSDRALLATYTQLLQHAVAWGRRLTGLFVFPTWVMLHTRVGLSSFGGQSSCYTTGCRTHIIGILTTPVHACVVTDDLLRCKRAAGYLSIQSAGPSHSSLLRVLLKLWV